MEFLYGGIDMGNFSYFDLLFPLLVLALGIMVSSSNKKKLGEIYRDHHIFVSRYYALCFFLIGLMTYMTLKETQTTFEVIVAWIVIAIFIIQFVYEGSHLLITEKGILYLGRMFLWEDIDVVKVIGDNQIKLESDAHFFGGFKLKRYKQLSEFETIVKGKVKLTYIQK